VDASSSSGRARRHAGVGSPFASCAKFASSSTARSSRGAMSSGADVLAAQVIGADWPTSHAFLATTEANAMPSNKQMNRRVELRRRGLFIAVHGREGQLPGGSVAAAGLDRTTCPRPTRPR